MFTKEEAEQFERYQAMIKFYEAEDWNTVIAFTSIFCNDLEKLCLADRGLWYHRAIALDNTGNVTEALLIFKKLMTDFPLVPYFRNSFFICLRSFERRIIARYASGKVDNSIEGFVSVLENLHYVNWDIRCIQLKYLALEKRFDEVRTLMNDYLELSPFDYDYLSMFLFIAKENNMNDLVNRINEIMAAVPDFHIDRVRMAGVMG